MPPRLEASLPAYVPRNPSQTLLYHVVADHLETFLASLDADPDVTGLPAYVQREFYEYLQCGVLAHGFLRLGCDTCHQELLLAFSCKRRGFCPSCAGRRMAQTAAHLVAQVIPWVPTRQWVVSVPVPVRYWMAASQELTAQVHTIIRTTIGQYYVNQAVAHGVPRAKGQPGSVTFMQRFGSALNLNRHFHCVFLEGVYLDRTDQGRKPRFVTAEPPTDADIAAVVHKISQRVIRKLRRLGYLEAGTEDVVATGHDPLCDDAPELAQTLAASVQQHLAFGERAGQRVRRMGAGFGVDGEAPTLTGPRCASVQGFSLHANTQVPAHRRDQLERLIRYTARGAVSLERLPQDAHGDLVYTFTHPWSDTTTGMRLSPLELLEKLAALVPLPRMHLVPTFKGSERPCWFFGLRALHTTRRRAPVRHRPAGDGVGPQRSARLLAHRSKIGPGQLVQTKPTPPPPLGLRSGLCCLESAGHACAGTDGLGAGSRCRPASRAPSASLTPQSVRASPAIRGRSPQDS